MSIDLSYCNSLLYSIRGHWPHQTWVFRIDWPTFWQTHLHLLGVSLLRSLHCFPVKFGILFTISLLTYKTFHEIQPVYLHSMLAASLLSRSFRSNKGISLSVSKVKTNTDWKAFHSCVPSFWNNLPLSVHSAISVATFKKNLKIHLFDLAFPPIDTSTLDGPLMLHNCYIDFAVEHWFSCHTTGPGSAGDIDGIEFDWFDFIISATDPLKWDLFMSRVWLGVLFIPLLTFLINKGRVFDPIKYPHEGIFEEIISLAWKSSQ